MNSGKLSSGKRSAAALPLAGILAAATALTGVAVFSVAEAGCPSPAQYVRTGHHIELVGGCITARDLPSGTVPANRSSGPQRSQP